MKFRPLQDRMEIWRAAEVQTTAGGNFIPDGVQAGVCECIGSVRRQRRRDDDRRRWRVYEFSPWSYPLSLHRGSAA
jgi:co-chaperonin GroES (HSP10)